MIDPIGRSVPHVSALKQATGEAVYVDDIPRRIDELHAGFVFSTRPYARIISIDEKDALEQDGVHSFVYAKDVRSSKFFTSLKYFFVLEEN